MFEQNLNDMTATHYISSEMYNTLTAANVGAVDHFIISEGFRKYTYIQAKEIIKQIDAALISCPKYLYKRILAERNSFVFAFGPDMERQIEEKI